MLEARGLDGSARLKYAANGALVACGEKYPLKGTEKDGFKSQRNRRVEIAFVDQAHRQPRNRGQVWLGPITVEPKVRAQGSLTEIVLSCGHGKKPEERKSKKDQNLEIVPDKIKGDTVHFEAIGSDVGNIAWTISEYENWSGRGKEFQKQIKGWQLSNGGNWHPHVFPQEVIVRAIHPDGTELSKKVRVFSGAQYSGRISIQENPGLKNLADEASKWLSTALKLARAELKVKILNGEVTFQTGFKEDKTHEVYWGYSVEGSFAPLLGISLKVKYPTPLEAVPQWFRDRSADFAIYAEIAGAIEASVKFERATASSKIPKPKAGAKGKIDVSAGVYLTIARRITWKKEDGDKYLLRVDGKGKSGVYAILESSKKWKIDDPVLGLTFGFAGIKFEASFQFWDGKISRKKELIILNKQESDSIDFHFGELLSYVGSPAIPGPL